MIVCYRYNASVIETAICIVPFFFLKKKKRHEHAFKT
jgi:hypothetical protein